MSDATDYLEDKIANVFRGTTFTAPAAVYAALFTAAPGEAGGGTEVSASGYSRQAVTFGAPSPSGVMTNSGAVTFGPAGASWGTVTHVAIFDASTAGNMMVYKALSASKTVASGDSVQFAVGALGITVT